MSIQSSLFDTLKTITQVGTRIYPLVLPQNPTFPAIVYQRISSLDTSDIEGKESLDMGRFQIKVFAKTYKESVDIAELVKTAMQGKGNKVMHLDDYEADTLLYSQHLDYIL